MRVLMVVRPAAGGMKEHVLALASGLVRAGHVVEVAAPGGSDITQAAEAGGLVVHPIPLVGPLHPVADPRAIVALRAVVRAGSFDIVHAHGFKAGFVGRLGARLGGVAAFVVTAHNHVLYRDETPRAAKWRYRTVERALTRYVSRYIAVSDSIRGELVDAYGLPPERVVTVRNGVDPAPFLPPQDRVVARAAIGLSVDAAVVGLAARFSTQKGLRHLVAAVPELIAADPSLRVVIGGSGPLAGELREEAVAVGAGGAIVWPGHVPDMPSFLAALDVYVSPAVTEALGIGLIEAALAGVPTVATDVGGASEVVLAGQTGVLVPPADPQALARAVLALLRDPERAQTLATEARKRALVEFAPERMVEATVAVYEAALAESRGTS